MSEQPHASHQEPAPQPNLSDRLTELGLGDIPLFGIPPAALEGLLDALARTDALAAEADHFNRVHTHEDPAVRRFIYRFFPWAGNHVTSKASKQHVMNAYMRKDNLFRMDTWVYTPQDAFVRQMLNAWTALHYCWERLLRFYESDRQLQEAAGRTGARFRPLYARVPAIMRDGVVVLGAALKALFARIGVTDAFRRMPLILGINFSVNVRDSLPKCPDETRRILSAVQNGFFFDAFQVLLDAAECDADGNIDITAQHIEELMRARYPDLGDVSEPLARLFVVITYFRDNYESLAAVEQCMLELKDAAETQARMRNLD